MTNNINLLKLFNGRTDGIGIALPRKDLTAQKRVSSSNITNGIKAPDGLPFSADKLPIYADLHLQAKGIIGVYPLLTDNTCNFATLDIDYKDTLFPNGMIKKWCDIQKLVIEIVNERFPEGNVLRPAAIKSSSGGLHLTYFFDAPIQAKLARQALLCVAYLFKDIDNIDFTKIEIFPKQNESTSFGNYVILPFVKEIATSQVSCAYDDFKFPDFNTFFEYYDKNRISEGVLQAFVDGNIEKVQDYYNRDNGFSKIKGSRDLADDNALFTVKEKIDGITPEVAKKRERRVSKKRTRMIKFIVEPMDIDFTDSRDSVFHDVALYLQNLAYDEGYTKEWQIEHMKAIYELNDEEGLLSTKNNGKDPFTIHDALNKLNTKSDKEAKNHGYLITDPELLCWVKYDAKTNKFKRTSVPQYENKEDRMKRIERENNTNLSYDIPNDDFREFLNDNYMIMGLGGSFYSKTSNFDEPAYTTNSQAHRLYKNFYDDITDEEGNHPFPRMGKFSIDRIFMDTSKKNVVQNITYIPYGEEFIHKTASKYPYANIYRGAEFTETDECPEWIIETVKEREFLLCNRDEEDHIALREWALKTVFEQDVKANYMPVFSGPYGLGKSSYIKLLSYLIGSHNFSKVPAHSSMTRFNKHKACRTLIEYSEVEEMNDKFMRDLKEDITSDTLNLELKGKDIIVMPDFANRVCTSNCIPSDSIDDDSRIEFYYSEIKGDDEHYKNFDKIIDNKNNELGVLFFYMLREYLDMKKNGLFIPLENRISGRAYRTNSSRKVKGLLRLNPAEECVFDILVSHCIINLPHPGLLPITTLNNIIMSQLQKGASHNTWDYSALRSNKLTSQNLSTMIKSVMKALYSHKGINCPNVLTGSQLITLGKERRKITYGFLPNYDFSKEDKINDMLRENIEHLEFYALESDKETDDEDIIGKYEKSKTKVWVN